jgi:hypothetical protein
VAGAYRDPGVAGYRASALGLRPAHGPAPVRAIANTESGRWPACACRNYEGVALVGYVITVYLIFFLTYTPLDVDHVRGVQGRYFVIALPVAAIFIAAMTNVGLPCRVLATMALAGSLIWE